MNAHRLFDYLKKIRRILNRGYFLDSLVFSLFVTFVIALIISLGFVSSGYRVDMVWFWLAATVGLLVLVIRYMVRAVCDAKAAKYADRFFGLNDSFVSALNFIREKRQGGMYELQEQQALDRVEQVDLSKIRFRPHWPILIATLCLCPMICVVCAMDDSDRVKEARAVALLNSDRSDQVEKYNQEVLEELEKEMDSDEKKMFGDSDIAIEVNKIKKDTDLERTLKRFSAVEKQIRRAEQRYGTKQDETHLDKQAILALKRELRTKAIADQLLKRNYKMAADKMREMQIKAISRKDKKKLVREAPEKQAKRDKRSSEEFEKAKARFKSLRKMAKRMGQVSRDDKYSKSDMKRSIEDLDAYSGEMEKLLKELDKLMADNPNLPAKEEDPKGMKNNSKYEKLTEKELRRLIKTMKKRKMMQGKFNQMCQKCDGKVGKLAKMMGNVGARRKFLAKMYKLRKKMGMCQNVMLGMSPMPGQGKKSGLHAGEGTDFRKTNQRLGIENKGANTRVTGLKGSGTSFKQVLDADYGSGVSGNHMTKNRDVKFVSQMESLIRREDIPEDLKDGVKRYFTTIHEGTEEEEKDEK